VLTGEVDVLHFQKACYTKLCDAIPLVALSNLGLGNEIHLDSYKGTAFLVIRAV